MCLWHHLILYYLVAFSLDLNQTSLKCLYLVYCVVLHPGINLMSRILVLYLQWHHCVRLWWMTTLKDMLILCNWHVITDLQVSIYIMGSIHWTKLIATFGRPTWPDMIARPRTDVSLTYTGQIGSRECRNQVRPWCSIHIWWYCISLFPRLSVDRVLWHVCVTLNRFPGISIILIWVQSKPSHTYWD